MSLRDQNIRFNFKALSELPQVIDQLETITDIIEKQSKVASAGADAVKAALLQQRNDTKASAEESLAISKEISRQMTLDKKAQLDQQTAQIKASEAQNTAYVKASEQERAAIAKEIAKQTTNEQQAELKRAEIELEASENRKTTIVREEEERRSAAVRAALLEQAQIAQRLHDESTAEFKAELNKQTIAVKAEADQQTAIVRGEQIRQTALLRGELAEQRALLQNHSSAYRELRNFIASAFGVYEVIQFGKDVIEAKSKVDIFRTGLQQMIGTKREADEVFARLLEMAKTTPFEVENLMEATFSLKAMGTATKDLLPTLEVLGNMAAVVGGEKLGLIAKAFTDVQNKGKLMKQELNQFAENGVPLYDLLAQSMGKTRDEVVKLAEAHEISFAQVKKAIFDASSEGGRYYNLMAIQAQTLGGQVSNLADKFFLAKAKLGDYYQNGLQKIVTGLSDLIEVMAGSDSAIARNTAIIKTAGTAWLTYQGVANSTAITEGIVAAAMAAKNGVIAAGNVIYGAYLLAVQRVTASQNVMTASQTVATTAARGLWAALAANPVGAVVAVVGALVTAYYAYSAATEEVTTKLGEEALQLKTQQSSLNALATAALGAAMGTKERKDYIDRLIAKYPEYFKGIDAERVSNTQLKNILDKVNGSYQTRISLARQAYAMESLEGELKKNLEKEAEILATLPAELQAKYGGSITKAVADMFANPKIFDKINTDWKGQLGFGDFSFDEAKKVADNLDRIGQKINQVDLDIGKSQTARIQASEAAENARWKAQQSTLKKGSDDYKEAEAAHLKELDTIRGTYQEKTQKAEEAHQGKMKTISLNSQKTIADILLNGDDLSYEAKKKYYDNLQNLEIEQVNKTKVSTKASEDELVQLRADALAKIQAIKEKYSTIQLGLIQIERLALQDSLAGEIEAFTTRNDKQRAYVTEETKSIKQLATERDASIKAQLRAEKELQQEKEKTTKLDEQAADAEQKARLKIAALVSDFAGQVSPLLGKISKDVLMVINNIDSLSGASLKSSKDALDQAQAHVNALQAIYDAGMGGTQKDIEKAKQGVDEAKVNVASAKVESATAVLGAMGAIYQVMSAVSEFFHNIAAETYKAIAEALERTAEAYRRFYAFISEQAKTAYKEQLDLAKGNFQEQERIITEYYDAEKERIAGADRIAAQIEYNAAIARANAESGEITIKNIMAVAAAQAKLQEESYKTAIKVAELEIQKAGEIRDAKLDAIDAASQAKRAALEQEIQNVRDNADQQKQVLEDQLASIRDNYARQIDAVKSAYDTQLAALKDKESQEQAAIRATFDLKAQLLEQATSDEIEKAAILDRSRNEALERYRAAEIARITATRDRILATLTDENERATVTAAFEQQLKDLHDQVEEAKLDKSKGVSLATKQLNAEQKENTVKLKTEETDAIAKLDAEYDIKFKALLDKRDKDIADLKASQLVSEQKLQDQITKLQNETSATILALQNKIRDNEEQTALQKRAAQNAYMVAVKQFNQEIFIANRELLIAELKAERAALEAKKNFFNANKITEAQNAITDVINQILSANYGTILNNPGIPVALSGPKNGEPIYEAFTKDGKKVLITYDKGREITVYDANGASFRVGDALGFVPETGEYLAKGTESVGGPYPDGIDTVPAWLTKGERVVTVEQNRQLAGISNEELVARSLFVQKLGLSMPDLGAAWADIGSTKLSLPAGIVSSSGANSIDLSELTGEMRKTRQAIENQKLLNVNIDRNGFALSEVGKQSIVNHWSTILNR